MYKIIAIAGLVFILGVFGYFFKRDFIGTEQSGTVQDLTKLPVYGYFIAGLKTEGDVVYIYWRDYRWHSILAKGYILSEKNLIAFCKSNKLDYNPNHEHSWLTKEITRNRKLDNSWTDFPDKVSDIVGHDKVLGMIHMNYNPQNGKFVFLFGGSNR